MDPASSADTLSRILSDMPPRAATASPSQDELLRSRRATTATTATAAATGRAVCADPLLHPHLPSGDCRCLRVRTPPPPTHPVPKNRRRKTHYTCTQRDAAHAVHAMHVEARARFMHLVTSRPGVSFRRDPRDPFYVAALYLAHALPALRVAVADLTLAPDSLLRIDASWKNGILADPANADIAALCHEYTLRIFLLFTAS
jgi:hypothetical protein